MNTYVKLAETINHHEIINLNYLEISVDYTKSLRTKDGYKRGIFVNIQPVEKNFSGSGRILLSGNIHLDGFRILYKELTRNNAKQVQQAFDKIEPLKQQITDIFCARRYNDILELIQTIN